ncbi:MAG: hypothetical protein U0457_18340 [Candidatus Sericytochromatia bacterium]
MLKKIILSFLMISISSCYYSEDIENTPDYIPPTPVVEVTPTPIPSPSTTIKSTKKTTTPSTKNKDQGADPTKTKKVSKKPTPTPTPTPVPTKTPTLDELGKIIYKKATDKLKNMNTFKTSIRSFVKGHYVQKEYVAEAKSASSVMPIIFQRPRKMKVRITEAPGSPNLINTSIYFDGGENVKIKVPGILGLFTFTFPIDKPELTGYRGYSLKDVDIVSLETRMDNPNAKVKIIGTSKMENADVYVLEVHDIKYMDDKITKELFYIRKSDYMIAANEMYENEDMVFQNKYEKAEYNPPVSDSDFKI